MQSTSNTLMIRPVSFSANTETMKSNAFQKPGDETSAEIKEEARREFDSMVALLRDEGLNVFVEQDTLEPPTPDSIFPNNWVSFHEDGTIVLYPMQAANRRLERRAELLEKMVREGNFEQKRILDLSYFEKEDKFLEGTGSMVLDRENKVVYACLSPRTNETVLNVFCQELGYTAIPFHAFGSDHTPIYHTNVMMCVGSRFILICLESIHSEEEKLRVRDAIAASGKVLISISLKEMNEFSGNMLELHDAKGKPLLVMSSRAFHGIRSKQEELSTYCKIIHTPLDMIEKNGGGSARCMIAEIHLPKKHT